MCSHGVVLQSARTTEYDPKAGRAKSGFLHCELQEKKCIYSESLIVISV